MAKAGTLPSSCYQTNLPIEKVTLRATHGACGGIDSDLSTSQPSELSTEYGDESEDDDEGNDEFESEGSDVAAADDDDDETRTPGYGSYDDAPQLAPEALFLVGSRSRFGRTVRFNGRFIQ